MACRPGPVGCCRHLLRCGEGAVCPVPSGSPYQIVVGCATTSANAGLPYPVARRDECDPRAVDGRKRSATDAAVRASKGRPVKSGVTVRDSIVSPVAENTILRRWTTSVRRNSRTNLLAPPTFALMTLERETPSGSDPVAGRRSAPRPATTPDGRARCCRRARSRPVATFADADFWVVTRA